MLTAVGTLYLGLVPMGMYVLQGQFTWCSYVNCAAIRAI